MPPTSRPQVISISPASATHAPGEAASAPPFEAPRWVQALVMLLLIALIIGAVAIAGALTLAHARDRHWINIASGSWVALAWHAEHGTLYPPLRDDAQRIGSTPFDAGRALRESLWKRLRAWFIRVVRARQPVS